MALVGYGGGVLAMSGSVGQQVHSHNRFGAYIRARTIPVNPQTDRQSAIRAAASYCAARWSNDLTQLQRDGWEVYAAAITRTNALGAQIKLTGFNHFIRSNVMAKSVAAPFVDVPPVNLTLPAGDPTIAATVDEAGQEISLVFDDTLPWASQATGRMFIFMSLPHNTGVNFIGGPYRNADVVPGIDPGGAVSPNICAVPFPVALSQEVKIAVTLREEDGRITDRFFDQVTCVA